MGINIFIGNQIFYVVNNCIYFRCMLSVKKKIEKTKVSSLRQIDDSRSMVFLLKCLKPIDLWCMFFFFFGLRFVTLKWPYS